MAAKCDVCSLMTGKEVYFQKCFSCGAVFCPNCNGQPREPYSCVKCKGANVRTYPGTHGDLLDLM